MLRIQMTTGKDTLGIADALLKTAMHGPPEDEEEEDEYVGPLMPWVTLYVGVYEVERRYGGPEEGGTYYDQAYLQEYEAFRIWVTRASEPGGAELDGELLWALEAELRPEELEAVHLFANRITTVYGDFFTTRRFSVVGRPDFQWRISWTPSPPRVPEGAYRYE
jgi:hypothetical protein